MDVVCVAPAISPGSGGHRTILHNLLATAARGLEITVCVEGEAGSLHTQLGVAESLAPGSADRLRWHLGWDIPWRTDLVIATSATSAAPARAIVADRHLYFVQDKESWFHPMSSEYLQAEISYEQTWEFITIGDWLRHRLLAIEPSASVTPVHFGAEVPLAVSTQPKYRSQPPVLLNWQPDKPRRLTQLVIDTACGLRETRPDIPLAFFGSDVPLPEPHLGENLGLLTELEMWTVFAESAVVVHFSSSNPSRVPFEVVACGTPCVELFTESTCFDFPKSGVVTVLPDAELLIAAITEIVDYPYAPLSEAALGRLEIASRQSETAMFADAVLDGPRTVEPPQPNRSAPDFMPRNPSRQMRIAVRRIQKGIGLQ